MSKKQLNIKKNIMAQISENEIKMKPRSLFILGSVLTFVGLIASIITSVFIVSIISFLLKEHGPMGEYRLALMLESFPWWLPILAVVVLVLGVWFLLRYDFSYRTNYVFIIIGFVLAVIIAGWAINETGLDNVWLKQGPMRGMMRQYLNDDNLQPGSGNGLGNQFRRGQMMKTEIDSDY